MKRAIIKATILLEKSLWVVIFERIDKKGYAVSRTVFGDEPTDPELYEFISNHFYQLKFTDSKDFKFIIKRKNPKRIQREVRKEMEKVKSTVAKITLAQEALRIELEKNKQLKKTLSKSEKEAQLQKKFLLRQAKKKKKKNGH